MLIPRPINIIKGVGGAIYIGHTAFMKRPITTEMLDNGSVRYMTYKRVK